MGTRIVVDTNVFVGACLGTGSAASVVRLCLKGELQPLMGASLFAEYEDVLAREPLMQQSRLSRGEREELLDIFLARCEWVRIFFAWRPNLPDEADNHLVELAVAGAAQFIVSRNLRDLVRAELKFPGIRCMDPAVFLEEMNR